MKSDPEYRINGFVDDQANIGSFALKGTDLIIFSTLFALNQSTYIAFVTLEYGCGSIGGNVC
jgi:hypothetical protein